MTETKQRSRSFWIFLSSAIFGAMLVATAIGLLVYYLVPLPTLRIAVVYPKENYAVVVTDQAQANNTSIKDCFVMGDYLNEDEKYTYPESERNKPIEAYDNVVTIENPLRAQVVFRERYQVNYSNGEVKTREIQVYGDGSLRSVFVNPDEV